MEQAWNWWAASLESAAASRGQISCLKSGRPTQHKDPNVEQYITSLPNAPGCGHAIEFVIKTLRYVTSVDCNQTQGRYLLKCHTPSVSWSQCYTSCLGPVKLTCSKDFLSCFVVVYTFSSLVTSMPRQRTSRQRVLQALRTYAIHYDRDDMSPACLVIIVYCNNSCLKVVSKV